MNEKIEYEDDIAAACALEKQLAEDEENESAETIGDFATLNASLVETDVRMIGDGEIVSQVVQLLSYVRHAMRNNVSGEMKIVFGNERANVEFNFDVNGMQIPDLVVPEKYVLN